MRDIMHGSDEHVLPIVHSAWLRSCMLSSTAWVWGLIVRWERGLGLNKGSNGPAQQWKLLAWGTMRIIIVDVRESVCLNNLQMGADDFCESMDAFLHWGHCYSAQFKRSNSISWGQLKCGWIFRTNWFKRNYMEAQKQSSGCLFGLVSYSLLMYS